MNRSVQLLIINIIVFQIGIFVLFYIKQSKPLSEAIVRGPVQQEVQPEEIQEDPINYDIADPVPDYLSYRETVDKLKEWSDQAPALTSVGVYGQSSQGEDLYYIKIGLNKSNPVVLITACIHGDEPLSASTVMGYIGTILDQYGDNEEITRLVDSRQIYFIPVVSPDSYPSNRFVNGVDPNRDFPTQRDLDKRSVPPVQALRDFFETISPKAVISGHTSGRVYLKPWGDQIRLTNNDNDYERILGRMSELSGYRLIKGSSMYGRPIYGTEMDWYYRNGAFATVMEFGTHQRVPSMSDIEKEFSLTFEAVLYFIEEAPKVEIRQYSTWDWKSAA